MLLWSRDHVSGSRPDSPHYSMPRSKRRRPGTHLTLNDKARAILAQLAKRAKTSQSKVVEEWLISFDEKEIFAARR